MTSIQLLLLALATSAGLTMQAMQAQSQECDNYICISYYRIHGTFGGNFNLAVWQFRL